jgi:glycosyltransferase involved in cell wall biosynthesis
MDGSTQAPRVYWLTTEFFPPETGGTGMIASILTRALAERGTAIRVITRQVVPPYPTRERVGALELQRLRPAGRMKGAGWRALPVMLAFIVRLASLLLIEARRYDVVIISGMKTIPLAAVPVCRLLRKPCVIRIESPFEIVEPISAESLDLMHGLSGRMLSRLLKRAQAFTLARADRVIAISDDVAGVLKRAGCRPERIAKIPNAVDLERFSPLTAERRNALRERLDFPAGRTIVVYAGRLSRAKGLMMLMQTWPRLIAADPSLLLVLVGSGLDSWDNCEEEIAEFVRSSRIEPHVRSVGQSNHVHEYLQAADLFVSPSDYEGFGLAVIEAMACGLPVVSTAVGIAPQVIEHAENGFLCPPKDGRAFGAALELALAVPDRWPRIGKLAREAVREFAIPTVIDRYLELCRELEHSARV